MTLSFQGATQVVPADATNVIEAARRMHSPLLASGAAQAGGPLSPPATPAARQSQLPPLAPGLLRWSSRSWGGFAVFPQGRPRIIEKNGRERRLDDNLTAVQPVWSPDSGKVAAAFGNQIRLYDANGTNPTQAAIPLRNQLLISSQAYDRDQQRRATNPDADANAAANTQPPVDQPLTTLPDEKLLVSYNPIVQIAWTADDLLYLETAYVRRMKNEADSVRSFSRWHRLALTAQALAPSK